MSPRHQLRRPRRLLAAAAVTSALLTAAGCGEDAGDEPGPPPSASSRPSDAASSSPAQGSPSAAASTSSAPSATFTDAPATGEPLVVPGLTMAAPAQGWGPVGTDEYSAVTTALAFPAQIRVRVGIGTATPSLDEAAALYNQTSAYSIDQLPQPPVVVAGQEWWHLAGDAGDGLYVEAFGTVTSQDQDVTVTFEFFDEVREKQRVSTIGSVLASATLS